MAIQVQKVTKVQIDTILERKIENICSYPSILTFVLDPQKNSLIIGSKDLDPDHSVGPDLGPNSLQRLSADDKSHH